MSKTFYIFRHALATRSTTGYGDTILTAEILPEETKPIEKMAHFLKDKPLDYCVSSEILRCKQTAGIISKATGKGFATDKHINEYYQESFEEFSLRIKDFLSDLGKQNDQHIAICTHGAVIAALKNLITTTNFTQDQLLDYPPCGALLIIKDKTFQVIDFNNA